MIKTAEQKAQKAAWQRTYYRRTKQERSDYARRYAQRNAAKIRSRKSAWRLAHLDTLRQQNRDGHLVRRYGLTAEAFAARNAAQSGLCAICRGEPSGRWPVLAVDHDHSSGRIRGLLCHRCNTMLGWLERAGVESVRRYLGW